MKKTGPECPTSRSDEEDQKETGTCASQERTKKPHQQGVWSGCVTEKK